MSSFITAMLTGPDPAVWRESDTHVARGGTRWCAEGSGGSGLVTQTRAARAAARTRDRWAGASPQAAASDQVRFMKKWRSHSQV